MNKITLWWGGSLHGGNKLLIVYFAITLSTASQFFYVLYILSGLLIVHIYRSSIIDWEATKPVILMLHKSSQEIMDPRVSTNYVTYLLLV